MQTFLLSITVAITVAITVLQICSEIRGLCPISGSSDSRKRHEMRLISKLATVPSPYSINDSFSMFNSVYRCHI
jgi:hypothetical protein